MTLTAEEAYEQICYYTLSLQNENFIHQHVVDAYAAQTAAETDKPIRLFFALIGLFLHIEKDSAADKFRKLTCRSHGPKPIGRDLNCPKIAGPLRR